jgi:Xaa-Pro aminopeptidase
MQMSYPPIVTINGGILHNHYRLNTLKEGDLFLNDSGAETAMGYAGDLTRTFPVSNTFTQTKGNV